MPNAFASLKLLAGKKKKNKNKNKIRNKQTNKKDMLT